MSSVPDDHSHLETREYAGCRSALRDADRVAQDLIGLLDGQVLVRAGDVEFLARRLRDLLAACATAYEDE